jgi:hypothetical protein
MWQLAAAVHQEISRFEAAIVATAVPQVDLEFDQLAKLDMAAVQGLSHDTIAILSMRAVWAMT